MATFGAAVGIAEILARYRDSPSYAGFTRPSFGYITLNALASIGPRRPAIDAGLTDRLRRRAAGGRRRAPGGGRAPSSGCSARAAGLSRTGART